MRRVRSQTGARLFLGKDVLSPQQVAGFFFAWRLKFVRLHLPRVTNLTATTRMKTSRMQLQLNLCTHSFTLLLKTRLLCGTLLFLFLATFCNLVHANKLSALSVGMLREICEDLGLNVDGIKQRKKKPLME